MEHIERSPHTSSHNVLKVGLKFYVLYVGFFHFWCFYLSVYCIFFIIYVIKQQKIKPKLAIKVVVSTKKRPHCV